MSELVASLFNGLTAGALLFVSVVDVRTMLSLVNTGKELVLKSFLPVWWPAGRDLMAPLGLLTTGGLNRILKCTSRLTLQFTATTSSVPKIIYGC